MANELPQQYHYPLFFFGEPRGWIDMTATRLVLDSRADFAPNVSVLSFPVERDDITLAEHVDEQLRVLRDEPSLQGMALAGTEELTVDGSPAVLLHLRPAGAEDATPLQCAQVHVLRHGVVFVITLTAEALGFDSVHARFVELLASMRFRR